MSPEQMLRALNEHGEDAGSNLNDGDTSPGWFGWSVTEDGILEITYTDLDNVETTRRWALSVLPEA